MGHNKIIEVELRARVDNSFLRKFKYKPIAKLHELDVYYSLNCLNENNWVMRIRKQNKAFFLTFKSNKEFGEGIWNEVNIPISKLQSKQLHEFLLSNNFVIDVQIRKNRKTYLINKMEVNIDTIYNLGKYIEVESFVKSSHTIQAKRNIMNFLLRLGVMEENIVQKGYVVLMRERQNGKRAS